MEYTGCETPTGKDRRTWLLVEELWNAYHADRERAYFDFGYEQGARIGRTEALRGGPSRKVIRPLVNRIFQLLDEAELASAARLSALLEAAWSLSKGPLDSPPALSLSKGSGGPGAL